MSGNQYTEEVMEGVNWLKRHAENEAFSFVFKCDNVQLNGKDVRWNNYTKPIQNEELTSLIRGAQTAMDQTEEEEMDWESEVDSLAKKLQRLKDTSGKQSSESRPSSNSSDSGRSGPCTGTVEYSRYAYCRNCKSTIKPTWRYSQRRASESNVVRNRGRPESHLYF
uniref:NS2 n=3 Tax=Canine parvovirus type 2 TaxID=10788 RepID=A0A0M4FM28_PAVC|nr:non-structural protein 2 [Canine parvovirus]ALC79647.1 NS2 [Canine parvovirus 2b]AUI41057.1 nonstructural protein 2 [Canine parvovirus 2a]UZC38199.1 NS2 [Canine parvovirus 2]WBW89350.1 NS2 [Protoparvovirus carnivoran1]